MKLNKNGNIVYQGAFAGVRYGNNKFYARFASNGIKEVPQGLDGYTKSCSLTAKEFEKLPRLDGKYARD